MTVPSGAYERDDESPDDRFYAIARKVVHIDDDAIAALTRVYSEVLPANGHLLDLMSSWRSHLPAGMHAVGLGLNAEEMADNPQVTRAVVHDVNREPRLPFGDDEFDGVTCAVSIQYVIHPVPLFREVHRVLRAGAPFVISFSNRCFPSKAVAVWLGRTDDEHVALVRAYFEAAGGFSEVTEDKRPSGGGDPLYVVLGRKSYRGAMVRPET